MSVVRKPIAEELFADKREIQRMVAEQSKVMGLPDDPTATPQKARAMMLASAFARKTTSFRAASWQPVRSNLSADALFG